LSKTSCSIEKVIPSSSIPAPYRVFAPDKAGNNVVMVFS